MEVDPWQIPGLQDGVVDALKDAKHVIRVTVRFRVWVLQITQSDHPIP